LPPHNTPSPPDRCAICRASLISVQRTPSHRVRASSGLDTFHTTTRRGVRRPRDAALYQGLLIVVERDTRMMLYTPTRKTPAMRDFDFRRHPIERSGRYRPQLLQTEPIGSDYLESAGYYRSCRDSATSPRTRPSSVVLRSVRRQRSVIGSLALRGLKASFRSQIE